MRHLPRRRYQVPLVYFVETLQRYRPTVGKLLESITMVANIGDPSSMIDIGIASSCSSRRDQHQPFSERFGTSMERDLIPGSPSNCTRPHYLRAPGSILSCDGHARPNTKPRPFHRVFRPPHFPISLIIRTVPYLLRSWMT